MSVAALRTLLPHIEASQAEWDQRRELVRLARQWLGTPFVHEGRIKGRCADCTFLAKVFIEAGLMPASLLDNIPHYSPQAHINRGGSVYMVLVQRYAKRQVSEAEAKIGDLVMFNIGRTFGHGALIVDPGWPAIIHADMGARMVIEGVAASNYERRFFSMW